MSVIPNKDRQPMAYWAFWALFFALLIATCFFAYWNIIPYESVMRDFFRISAKEISATLLGSRFRVSQAWLVGAIVWAVCQGFQVGYLLLVESEKAMDWLVKQSASRTYYNVNDYDPNSLKTAKKHFNEAPLRVLSFMSFARLVAYGIEIPVNLSQFPAWDNGGLGFLVALFTLSFNWSNLAIFLITLVAVEYLVLGIIMMWRMIQLFKQSGAYKKGNKENKENKSAH